MTFNQSSKRTPCPVCGRTKDGDCRWSTDIIFCHQSSNSSFADGMKLGDTIQIHGEFWALVKLNGGFSGMAAVFKPDKGKSRNPIKASQIKAVAVIKDQERLDHQLFDFRIAAEEILSIPPLEYLRDSEIKIYRNKAEYVLESAKKMEARLTRLARSDLYIKEVLTEFKSVRRQIQYQLKDLSMYCDNPAGYWQAFILPQK